MLKVLFDSGRWQGRVIHRHKEGAPIHIQSSVSLLRDGSGRPLGSVAVNRDITDLVLAEQELARHRDHLETMVEERTRELAEAQARLLRQEKLAVLGQLAGGVGHELRTPLGAIKNAAYLIDLILDEDESTGTAPEVKEGLAILNAEVDACDRIISSLLAFARTREPVRRESDLNQIVQQAMLRVILPENVRLVERFDPNLPAIQADREQLHQVFRNLVKNAVQAMPQGGQLAVETSVQWDDPPSPSGAGWVTVVVADTGVGIARENLDKLFEPLFTTKAKGIGLGLALVKMLVEGHKGTIAVRSEVDQGAVFTIRLPVERGGSLT
jgi:signal transduction histidine kinase